MPISIHPSTCIVVRPIKSGTLEGLATIGSTACGEWREARGTQTVEEAARPKHGLRLRLELSGPASNRGRGTVAALARTGRREWRREHVRAVMLEGPEGPSDGRYQPLAAARNAPSCPSWAPFLYFEMKRLLAEGVCTGTVGRRGCLFALLLCVCGLYGGCRGSGHGGLQSYFQFISFTRTPGGKGVSGPLHCPYRGLWHPV